MPDFFCRETWRPFGDRIRGSASRKSLWRPHFHWFGWIRLGGVVRYLRPHKRARRSILYGLAPTPCREPPRTGSRDIGVENIDGELRCGLAAGQLRRVKARSVAGLCRRGAPRRKRLGRFADNRRARRTHAPRTREEGSYVKPANRSRRPRAGGYQVGHGTQQRAMRRTSRGCASAPRWPRTR